MKKFIFIFLTIIVAQSIVIAQVNTLTPKEEKQGWKLLFNGNNLDGWTSVGKDTPPTNGWEVKDGILTVNAEGSRRGGDIITKEQFSDFEFSIDFNISEGANSGIKYFFFRYQQGGWLGLEYQVLDDNRHPDAKMGRDGNRLQGGLYDMFAPSPKKKDNPPGQWNQARIVAKGSKVTHYLNGKKVLSFDRKSETYKKAWELSKFNKSVPMFGDIEKGHILLQDHEDRVSFRNIKIKVLK